MRRMSDAVLQAGFLVPRMCFFGGVFFFTGTLSLSVVYEMTVLARVVRVVRTIPPKRGLGTGVDPSMTSSNGYSLRKLFVSIYTSLFSI